MLQWKPIKNYESLYEISNYGVVRSVEKVSKNRWGTYVRPKKNLARNKDKSGFYRLSLRKDGKNKKHHIHLLVARHFLENSENKKRVKHINGIKTDNRYLNLEYI